MKKFALISAAIFAFSLIGAYFLAPGSDVYAQIYRFGVSGDSLAKKLQSLKNHDSDTLFEMSSDVNDFDASGHLDMTFRITSENCYALTKIEKNHDHSNLSSILLISFSDNSGKNWALINADFDRKENIRKKRAFRSEILDKLNLSYFDDGNGMLIFWK